MRQVLIFFLLILGFMSFSQTVPQKINYQGAVRTSSGTPIINQAVGIKFRILQGSTSGASVYTESLTVNTNGQGLFTTQIGAVSNFAAIPWNNGPFFLEVSMDVNGGSSYVVLSNPQELVSVPYALSAPSPTTYLDPVTNILSIGTSTVGLPTVTVNAIINPTATPQQALGLAQVVGAYPNFSVMVAPLIAYNPTVGVLSLSSIPFTSPSYNYTYNVTPELVLNGNVLIVGPPSNSVQLPSSSIATPNTSVGINPAGIGTITATGTNSFNVNIPPTTLTQSLGATVAGAFPNYTISAPPTTSIGINSAGIGTITATGTNSFNVNIPPTTLTQSLGATVTGAFPNYTISAPPTSSIGINSAGIGTITATGTNSFNVNIPPTTLTQSLGATITGAFPNYTISAPPTSSIGIHPVGIGTVNATGTNSFNINIPPTALTQSLGATVTGAFPNYTVSAPQQVNITATGATTVGGTYPNINVGSQSVTVSAYNGILAPGTNGGLLSVFGAYPNYSVSVIPQIAYSSATGSLVLSNPTTGNVFQYNITPNVTISSNTIQSGPSTNTAAVVTPPAQVFNVAAGTLLVSTTPVQLSSPMAFTKQSSSSEIDLFVHTFIYSGLFVAVGDISFELRIDGVASAVSSPHYLLSSSKTEYVTLKAIFSGLAAGPHTASIWAKTSSGVSSFVQIDPNNNNGRLILKETY